MVDTGYMGEEQTPRRDIREQIRREARVVGLRDVHLPSLESVERRRLQLWVLTTGLLLAVSGAILLLWLGTQTTDIPWLDPRITTVSVLGLAVAFGVYAIEKELHLRRLTHLLVEERALTAALSNRLRELSSLLEAGKAMNSVLELSDVLDVILGGALELLEAEDGSIMLLEPNGELVAVCSYGNERAKGARAKVGEGIAGRVAQDREPLLLIGGVDADEFPAHERERDVPSAMCYPLINRGTLLGVLNVNSTAERLFSEYDLRALGLFAEHAASAIANARLYEATRAHVEELIELDHVKTEFIASVSHDLRTPLTSIIGSAAAAKRLESEEQRREMLDVVERQARHLAAMVEQLLTASELEAGRVAAFSGEVDLRALVDTVALDSEAGGQPVRVEGPGCCLVRGDPDAIRRIVENLIDNAYKHGAPPVRIEIEEGDEETVLSVVDAGPGIAEEDRERVFDRFYRSDVRGSGRPGIGLGLSNVRALAEACGGWVSIEGGSAGGAVFRVAFLKASADRSDAIGETGSPAADRAERR